MAVLSDHRAVITLDHQAPPIKLDVTRLDLAMDEEWIPYIQATVTCPLGDGEVAGVNPQAEDIWATVTVTRLLGRTDRLRDLTRRYRRQTLADITARFRGRTLGDVTASTYHDYEAPGTPRRADVTVWRLMLREVRVDIKAATVTMTLASGEARLTDWQHMSPNSDRIPGATIVDKINWTLNLAGFPQGVSFAPANVPTDAEIGDEALRVPGSSALDYLTGLTRHHGLMLWCDEAGLWHLAEDRSRSAVAVLRSAGRERSVTSEVSVRSRDDDGWVTAVMVVYTWQGVDSYDYYTPWAPNPERALILRYNRPYPGPGLAAHIFEQVRNRGRSLDLQAVSTYDARPGQTVRYINPRETVTGRLAAIRWQFPEDEMSIRLREVGAA